MKALLFASLLGFSTFWACGEEEKETRTDQVPSNQQEDEQDDQNAPTEEILVNPFDQDVTGLQTNFNVTHDGLTRKFHFFVPSNLDADRSYPLVLLLHGHGGSGDQMLGLNGKKAPYKVWLDIAAREQIFILVPEGVVSPDDKLGWNDCRGDTATNPSTNDVEFLVGLAEAMTDTYPIDEKRIFSTGTSNGGHMSFRLAIEAGDKFAAIAPILAALPSNSKCTEPDTKVALLLVNGTSDSILPYNGGPMAGDRGEVISTINTISFWTDLNQNDAAETIENLPDINNLDSSTVVRTSYRGDSGIQDVTLITMDGAGHTEPSISEQYSGIYEAIAGIQNHDIEMAEIVWEFFKDKSR